MDKFLDKNGLVYVLPKKLPSRMKVLEYLASKFEDGREYKEREVNALLDDHLSYKDICLFRRELVEKKLVSRTRDGAIYQKNVNEESESDI